MLSSSNDIVLASSPYGPIIAYDPFSGNPLARFTGSRSPRCGLILAGSSFIAASHVSSNTGSGSIHLYNWWSSTPIHHLPVPEPVAPLAATCDSSYIFAGGVSGNIHALSLPSGNLIKSIHLHAKSVTCLKVSDDGLLLISGGDDGTINVVPLFHFLDSHASVNATNFVLHQFAAHDGPVTSISTCIGLCNNTFVSCSLDFTCKFWCLNRGTHLQTVAFPCPILELAEDPTQTDQFYAAGSDGSVYRGKLNDKKCYEISTWPRKHGAAIQSVAVVNGGRNLVSVSEDGSVWIREIDSGQVVLDIGDNNVESISGMAVARGPSRIGRGSVMSAVEVNDGVVALASKELKRAVKDTIDLEDVMKVAANDKSKAIDMLESAIEVYENLLELILIEAKRSTARN